MLNLNINLKNKKSYTSFWNYFSKSLILKKQDKKILLLVENQKYADLYEKIFDFLWKEVFHINNYSNFCDLVFNENDFLFLITIDDFLNIKDNFTDLEKNSIVLKKWEKLDLNLFVEMLVKIWFVYSDFSINWSYKKSWDLLHIISFDWKKQYKISFWWDIIEEILEQKNNFNKNENFKKIETLVLWNNKKIDSQWKWSIIEILNSKNIFTVIDQLDFHENYEKITKSLENFCSFDYIWQWKLSINLGISNLIVDNVDSFKNIFNKKNDIYIYTKNTNLIENFTKFNNLYYHSITKTKENLLKSFQIQNLYVICDDNISNIFIKKRIKRNLSNDIDLLLKIKSWDFIVHIDHWIWIFKWIVTKKVLNIKKEYIEIDYKNNDKLFVPINEVKRVSKYVWDETPELTWLNTKEWERKLKKVNEDVERIAKELLETHAKRIITKWFYFELNKEKINTFQHSFPYIYTESQIISINEILNDMNSDKNMDRLLVWDVWFGKTEVAFNAIYNAFLNKKQSCLISPLVVLAYEHFEKAKERFSKFWVKVEILTRLESQKHTNLVLKKLSSWEIDLIIWTHKLLWNKILFKNLWLIILDEEHKFWVEHKEKIKSMKIKVDTLSMSATPIPRSLNLALSSIKDISIIKDAPIWRKEIKTIVTKFNENVILEWYKNEISRWWQIFFIHNRIETIDLIFNFLSNFIPREKIVITHWRLSWDELEDRIIDFKNRKYDVLLSTTVIENWIDFPNVNTIFINDADNFWLSQIHQLRWRVWRSDRQSYCYILYKKENISKDAAKRLKTIVDYSYLWAWFELAMKDLEIRWWWDILWIRQSWINKYISVNIFLDLLEKKITELKNNKENIFETIIDLNVESYINDNYFNSDTDKINFYKEIENIENLNDLNLLIQDFININWSLSKQEKNLFDVIKLRILSNEYKIIHIKKVWVNYQIDFNKNIKVDDLKNFLKLDKNTDFVVVDLYKIRISVKNFENDEKFLQYMLGLLKKD